MTGTEATRNPDDLQPLLRMDGVLYSRVLLDEAFRLSAPVAHEWRMYVVRGDGIRFGGQEAPFGSSMLENGSIIGMAGSTPHWFARHVENAAEFTGPWQEEPLGATVEPGRSVVVIGRISQSALPALSLLNTSFRIDPAAEPELAERIGALIDWISAETVRNDIATAAIVQRLAEITVIEISRHTRSQGIVFSERPGGGEYDPRIWRAIAAITRDPQMHWTVDSMAAVAGMSRSAFAARYRETVGTTPLRSLRRLRMHRAASSLTSPGAHPLGPLASAIGYGSEAAFCRAFASEFGYPPKRYGQNGQHE